MKKTKKQTAKQCLTGVLTGAMLMSTLPAVCAAENTTPAAGFTFTQPCVIDYFNNFDGYVKAGNGETSPMPVGFDANSADGVGLGYRSRFVKSGAKDGNEYLSLANSGTQNSGMKMMFDETIRTGKLQISFDMRVPDITKIGGFTAIMHDAADNDNNNVKTWVGSDGYESYGGLIGFGSDGSIYIGRKNGSGGTLIADLKGDNGIGNSWHKYELTIDFDKMKVYATIDGDADNVKEAVFSSAVKTLDMTTSAASDGSETSSVDMDNFFIKHYPNAEDKDNDNQMTADYSANGNKADVYIAFSKGLNIVNGGDGGVQKNDFRAVNVATGNEYTPSSALLDENGTDYAGVKLTFDNMPGGTYKIICKSSNKYDHASDSNTFSTSGTTQNVMAENILVEDDFENYHGGMPANAVNVDLEKSTRATKADGKDGAAIQFEGARDQIIYQFPYAVTSGKVTYEFDVNHTNGLWATGVLGAECFETDTINADTYGHKEGEAPNTAEPTNAKYLAAVADGATEEDKAAWNNIIKSGLREFRKQTTAVGCYNSNSAEGVVKEGSTVTEATVMGQLTKSYNLHSLESGAWQGVITGLSAPKEQWNHVKVEVDLDSALYNVTVGEGESAVTKTFKVLDNRFRPDVRYKKKMVNGTEKWVKTMKNGIEGIFIGKLDDDTNDNNGKPKVTSTVKYDNFKVYTDNSYNNYTDFNLSGAERANASIYNNTQYPPTGWTKQDRYQTLDGKFTETEGKAYSEENKNDKALKIEGADTWSYEFSESISANTPFVIEFDVKFDTANTNNRTVFRLLPKDMIYSTFENTATGDAPFEAINTDNKGLLNNGKRFNSHIVAGFTNNPNDSENGNKNVVLYGQGGFEDWTWDVGYGNSSLVGKTPVPVSVTGWNHYKLYGRPNGDNYMLKASVDSGNGEVFTEEWTTNVETKKEIAAFGIGLQDGNSKMSIDNFVVKELNADLTDKAVNNVNVSRAVTTNIATGEEKELKDGFAVKGQDMKVEFSAPIASVDGINVYKYNVDNTVSMVKTTNTLSADGKTVEIDINDTVTTGDNLVLEVSNNVKPIATSNLSHVEATAVAFTVTEPVEEVINVDDFRLYKLHKDDKKYNNKDAVWDDVWIPATETDVKNATADDMFNFIAKGYNTGDSTDLVLVKAFKDPASTLITEAKTENVTVSQYGQFEKAISDTGFEINDINGSLETYLWEAGTLKPVCSKYKVDLTKAMDNATEGE